ncbi:MAG: maleylpyruvate isomerase family mycothiol-dependent enzyme [Streptosporangiales bacterium]|nr:maleylpyruvate isomerase family mycothiol-dependent enzyme [Streptosporangiales bacterium]
MDAARYLDLLRADSDRLLEVSRGRLGAPVPSCPGWTVDDLAEHVAYVYGHKVVCILEQRPPESWPPARPEGDVLDWLRGSRDRLVAEFESHRPGDPSYTPHAPDQTVGYWYRRMALETAVHRVDAELAAGTPSPVADDLAVDGVDEILDVFLSRDWSGDPQPGSAASVELLTGGGAWEVALLPDSVVCSPPTGRDVEATVEGAPSELLLWLWGRAPDSAVRVTGEPDAVRVLRDRLRLVTW